MQAIYSIVGVVIGGLFAYILLSRKKEAPVNTDQTTSLTLLLQQMAELQKTVDHKLGENEKSMRESMQFQSTQSNQI
ncbi:MAG: hypothetical protein AAB895_03335, partial [Patescibacteria group bacterium]